MKSNIYIKYSFAAAWFLSMLGCEDALKEDVFTQSHPDILKSEEGIFSVLSSAYGHTDYSDRWAINLEEFPTDIAYQTGGFEEGVAIYYLNFTWDPSTPNISGFYLRGYDAIRDANVVLENLDNAEIPGSRKLVYEAEAKFLRAYNCIRMFYKFGPVPLPESFGDTTALPRPSEEEFRGFVEAELLDVIEYLPLPGQEAAYGRATKGAAMGALCKFYLNTKQWEKAAGMAKDIMDLGYYELYPVYEDMLKVGNERNKEMIWVSIAVPNSERGKSNTYISAAFPPGFHSWPEKGLVFQTNWSNPQTQYRLRDDFYHSFDPADKRRDAIMTQYVNGQGNTINLLATPDNTRSFRFWPDPDAQGEQHGNDLPEIRYADILLSRAEALNELNGPNQESIDLINQVRARADVPDLKLVDFPSKTGLREHILQERAWEFYSEGIRRQDLIRMDKFIEYAHNRGITNAREYHRLYPLPQAAMDSNPLLEQNTGY